MSGRVLYLVYCCVAAATLMAFNSEVTHPYMVSYMKERFPIKLFSLSWPPSGRAVPCPAGVIILHGRVVDLGFKNNYPTRIVGTDLFTRHSGLLGPDTY